MLLYYKNLIGEFIYKTTRTFLMEVLHVILIVTINSLYVISEGLIVVKICAVVFCVVTT